MIYDTTEANTCMMLVVCNDVLLSLFQANFKKNKERWQDKVLEQLDKEHAVAVCASIFPEVLFLLFFSRY